MLQTAQNEWENEPYMRGKLRMSIFWSNLRIVNLIFLEEVMGIVTLKGQKRAKQIWLIKRERQHMGKGNTHTWAENGWIVG